MEKIEFNYPEAKRLITKRAHVGVVGSGDMEVLLEPNSEQGALVFITTSVNGFGDAWKVGSGLIVIGMPPCCVRRHSYSR